MAFGEILLAPERPKSLASRCLTSRPISRRHVAIAVSDEAPERCAFCGFDVQHQIAIEDHAPVAERHVGNAGGLTLRLNGFPLPPLGRQRQVVKDKVIDRGTLQELQSETHNRT